MKSHHIVADIADDGGMHGPPQLFISIARMHRVWKSLRADESHDF